MPDGSEGPALTDADRELAHRIQSADPGSAERIALRNQLVERHLPFATYMARLHRGHIRQDHPDYEQAAAIGLILAADRYDGRPGVNFCSYASRWIRKSMMRKGGHVGGELVAMPYKIEGKRISAAEATCIAGLVEIHAGPFGPVDTPVADPGRLAVDAKDQVDACLRRLSTQERLVLTRRFGLDGLPDLTLQDLGDCMGCSKQRAQQVEAAALRKLRLVGAST
jgi:RNA polymerase sigma factor (sigma-70 family)